MIQIDMPMPEKCSDCIFCNDHCSCVASDYDGLGINVGCAYRTERRDIRCPLKEHETIVRCKDCIHWDEGHTEECKNSDSVCFRNGWCKPDWYCADGERKAVI